MRALLLLTLNSQLSTFAYGQQPQTGTAPIFATNAKYVQGVGPGYWPTTGSGLTLNLAAGTATCGDPPAAVSYAGGALAMTDATTNYVYLDPAASCAPAKNTTGFQAGQIPLAKVLTSGGAITSITDARNWFQPSPCAVSSTGAVKCSALGTNQDINLNPSGTGRFLVTTAGSPMAAFTGGDEGGGYSEFGVWAAGTGVLPYIDLFNVTDSKVFGTLEAMPPQGLKLVARDGLTLATVINNGNITLKPTGTGQVFFSRANNVRFADQFPGADAGEKIVACIGDLPLTGGICDARGLEGTQSVTTDLVMDRPVTLLLGASVLNLGTHQIQINATGVHLVGLGREVSSIQYSGTSAAILVGSATSSAHRSALSAFSLSKTGTVREAGSIGIVQYGGQSNRYENIQVIAFETGILLDGDGGNVAMVEVPMESVRLSGNLVGLDMTGVLTTFYSRALHIVGPGQATVGSFGIRQENNVGQGGYFSQTSIEGIETGVQQGGNLWFYAGLRLELVTNGITWAGGAADNNIFFAHGINVTNDVQAPPTAASANQVFWDGQQRWYTDTANAQAFHLVKRGAVTRLAISYDPVNSFYTFNRTGVGDVLRLETESQRIAVGINPASSGGSIGIPNNKAIRARNAANDDNFDVLNFNTSNQVDIATSSAGTNILGWLTIGSGTAITQHLSATASLDFTALAANTCEVLTLSVPGAADGDTVTLGIPNALADVDGATGRTIFFGWVSAADAVSVRRCNVTGTATADPASATVRADVWKH